MFLVKQITQPVTLNLFIHSLSRIHDQVVKFVINIQKHQSFILIFLFVALQLLVWYQRRIRHILSRRPVLKLVIRKTPLMEIPRHLFFLDLHDQLTIIINSFDLFQRLFLRLDLILAHFPGHFLLLFIMSPLSLHYIVHRVKYIVQTLFVKIWFIIFLLVLFHWVPMSKLW